MCGRGLGNAACRPFQVHLFFCFYGALDSNLNSLNLLVGLLFQAQNVFEGLDGVIYGLIREVL